MVLVGSTERHAKSLAKFITENLEEVHQTKVRYLTPEGVMTYFEQQVAAPTPTEQTVRGYKVRTVQQIVDPKDATARRNAVAEVIARSLKKSKKKSLDTT